MGVKYKEIIVTTEEKLSSIQGKCILISKNNSATKAFHNKQNHIRMLHGFSQIKCTARFDFRNKNGENLNLIDF